MFYPSVCKNVRTYSSFRINRSDKKRLLTGIVLLFIAVPLYGQPDTQNQQEKELRSQRLMVKGMTQSFLGYHDRAIPIYEEALNLTPSSATLNSALAESHEYLGDFSSAIFYANQALQFDPSEIHFHKHLIHLHIQSDDLETAEVALISLMDRFPNNIRSLEDLVEIQSLLGKTPDALATQENLIKIQGASRANLEIKLHLLKVLKEWNQYENTLFELERVAPQIITYKRELALLYISQNRPEDAIPKIKEALHLSPSDPTLTSMLARLYEDTGQKAEALALYENQPASPATDPDAAYQRALQLVNNATADSSSHKTAQRLLRQALNHSPNHVDANVLLGTLLYEEHQYTEASPYLRHAVELNPRAQDVWLLAADALYNSFDYSQALRFAEDALLLFPGQLPLLELSAQANIKMHNYNAALSQINEFLSIAERSTTYPPSEIQRLKAEALASAGLIHGILQETSTSDSLHAVALSLQPNNPRVLGTIALSLAEQGKQLNKALQHAQKAIEDNSDNTELMNTLGRVYFKLKNYSEAEKWFNKVIQSNNTTPLTLEYVGDLLIESGKPSEAIDSWTNSLELYPDNPSVIQKLENYSNKP